MWPTSLSASASWVIARTGRTRSGRASSKLRSWRADAHGKLGEKVRRTPLTLPYEDGGGIVKYTQLTRPPLFVYLRACQVHLTHQGLSIGIFTSSLYAAYFHVQIQPLRVS